jgi:hypothetical protein
MPNFNFDILLTHSKIFGNTLEVTDESLGSLDKNTWSKVLARLNHLARTERKYSVKNVLVDWFSGENYEYANNGDWRFAIMKMFAVMGVCI